MAGSPARPAASVSAMSGPRRRWAARSVCSATATVITIDAVDGRLDVDLSEDELAARRKDWKPRTTDYQSGALWRYAQTVGDARRGAITHPGAKAETHVYADI